MNARLCGSLGELAMLRIRNNKENRVDVLLRQADFKVVIAVGWDPISSGKGPAFRRVSGDKRRQFTPIRVPECRKDRGLCQVSQSSDRVSDLPFFLHRQLGFASRLARGRLKSLEKKAFFANWPIEGSS